MQAYQLGALSEIDAEVTEAINFELGQHWQPTAENYFSRIKKDALLTIAKDTISEEWASTHARHSKAQLIGHLQAAPQMNNWMPESMQ